MHCLTLFLAKERMIGRARRMRFSTAPQHHPIYGNGERIDEDEERNDDVAAGVIYLPLISR